MPEPVHPPNIYVNQKTLPSWISSLGAPLMETVSVVLDGRLSANIIQYLPGSNGINLADL